MNSLNSKENEMQIQSSKKNLKLPMQSNYAQLNDNSTRNNSLSFDKNSILINSNNISCNRFETSVLSYHQNT